MDRNFDLPNWDQMGRSNRTPAGSGWPAAAVVGLSDACVVCLVASCPGGLVAMLRRFFPVRCIWHVRFCQHV